MSSRRVWPSRPLALLMRSGFGETHHLRSGGKLLRPREWWHADLDVDAQIRAAPA